MGGKQRSLRGRTYRDATDFGDLPERAARLADVAIGDVRPVAPPMVRGVRRCVLEPAAGWYVGRIIDPFGHEWEIAKPLGDWPAPVSPSR